MYVCMYVCETLLYWAAYAAKKDDARIFTQFLTIILKAVMCSNLENSSSRL